MKSFTHIERSRAEQCIFIFVKKIRWNNSKQQLMTSPLLFCCMVLIHIEMFAFHFPGTIRNAW